ncbi:helix-turn-helix domain-containing protein [Micromonospora costi]|uniref:helix-turn-helix domain-containing protein n=1 Tax=Micromonospora costi TaxID=1530042 RepID=UPI0034015904
MTSTPPAGPQLLGPLLTQLRLARGWSQRRLAAELCAAAGVPTLSRHEVSRWERQARLPGDFWLRWLAAVLAAPVELLTDAAARSRRLAPPSAEPAGGGRSRAALLALAQRWLADPHATLLVAGPGLAVAGSGPAGPGFGVAEPGFAVAEPGDPAGPGLPGPGAAHHAGPGFAVAGPDPAAGSGPSVATGGTLRGPRPGRPVDLAGLRRLDDLVGGADLAPLGAAALGRAARALPRSGRAGRRRLLPLLAESAQLAGWLAADAGDPAGGLDAYRLGLRAAAAAGDPALGGHVLGSASHLLAGAGDAEGALVLARTAYAGSRRSASPGLRALLLHRVALAAALGGRPDAASRALDAAQRVTTSPDPLGEPPWLYWLDGAELAAMTGRTLVALGRPRRAEALLGATGEPGRPRRAAIYGGWLARGYLQLGEVELACEAASAALVDAIRAGSPRAVTELTEVRRRLANHRRMPAVRRHAALVAAARPYLPRPPASPARGRPRGRAGPPDTGGYHMRYPTG